MTIASADQKVIIIGAGVAGLVLAQILRKQGIPYEIYDRDDGTRWQGWAIALDKCLDLLYPLLPDDLQDPREASPNFRYDKDDSFWVLNGVTHEFLGLAGNAPKGHPEHIIHADRAEFRNIFMRHAGVQFDKAFERYEQDDKGVTVFFTDGSSARGTVLVGADGASSKVRGQLLDGFNSSRSKYTCLQGHATIGKQLTAKVLGPSGCGLLVADRDQKTNCLLMDYNDDGTATFAWTVAYKVADWEKEQDWAKNASADELHEKALKRTEHWPDYLKEVVEKTGPEGIHRPPIRLLETILPDDTLPKGRITLVGDAMNSMVPFRGMGANTGISGASILGRALMEGFKNDTNVDGILRSFESDFIPKAREAVLKSHAAGEGDENDDLSGGRVEDKEIGADGRPLRYGRPLSQAPEKELANNS